MASPEPRPDDDALLALTVVDGEASDEVQPEEHPEIVAQLESVQQIITALDSLGVGPGPATEPPFPMWGPFVLNEQIGQGSFGVVCRGFDPAVAREIAVKLYSAPDLPSEPRLMARVHHRNVVAVFGAAVHDGRPGLWMEFVRGRTLAERVQSQGPLPLDDVIRIGIELCHALEAVHDAHLVHQDVKARNAMERDEGGVVLMDFGAGSARSTGDNAPGRLMGTPLYTAPEVILGKAPSAQSDVYSLGVLLHYLVTGAYPVPAARWDELRRLFEREGPPAQPTVIDRLRELRPAVPGPLARVIARAVAPDAERYGTAADLRSALAGIRQEDAIARARIGTRGRRVALAASLLAAGLAGVALGTMATRGEPRTSPRIASIRRLTWDTGLTIDPSRSDDGKLLAYSSDRGGQGNLDIWVQHVIGGGLPLRLTRDPADESQPSISPDGSQIAFRSERDGGGVYLMPTLGGDARLFAARGSAPRFAPDGKHIAYIEGVTGGDILVAPVSGGSVRRFPINALTAPTWSSEGDALLVPAAGTTDQQDWWVVPVSNTDGQAIRTGAFAALKQYGFEVISSWPTPWTWTKGRVLFHARYGDSTGLWEADLAPSSFALRAAPRRLAVSTEDQFQPSFAADGSLVFSTRADVPFLWELALDASGRVSPTAPRVLIPHFPGRGVHDLSRDGRWMAFTSAVPGHAGIAVKDLQSGTETALTPPSATVRESFPVISGDGSTVLYTAVEDGIPTMRRVSMTGGIPDEICRKCGFPLDWSPDNRYALVQYGVPTRASIGVLDLATVQGVEILRHAQKELYRAGFSPDGRWVTFHTSLVSGSTQEFVAPFRGMAAVDEREWIPIAGGPGRTDAPRWSADGNLIYYVSDVDGYRCIWGRRLEPATKRPVGEAFAVHHAHAHKRPIVNLAMMSTADVELSVAPGKLVYSVTESRSNIWLAELR